MTAGAMAAAGCAAAAGEWSKRATVTAAPSTDSGNCSSDGAGTCDVLTGPFTATPVGGNGVYTYQWENIGSNASAVVFGTGTAASTTVTVTGIKDFAPGAVYTTTVRCRVSSPSGADVFSNNVVITTTHVRTAVVQLSNQSITDVVIDPADAFASYTLENDGDVIQFIGSTPTDLGDWVTPKSDAPGLYEVFATLNSGSLGGGTTGSWIALSTTRIWFCQQTTVGVQTANLTISIRNNGGPTLASASITLRAEVGL